jgi:hypothetical protein
MFKMCLLNNPRLIVITQILYMLSVKHLLILAIICHTAYYTYNSAVGVVQSVIWKRRHLEWRLSEETGFGDVSFSKSPTEQTYFLKKEFNVICLQKISTHYVLKELLYRKHPFYYSSDIFYEISLRSFRC